MLPSLFYGYKTASFFVFGVIAAGTFGGYFSYQRSRLDSIANRWSYAVFCAVIVAAIVLFLSMLIIVNTVGSQAAKRLAKRRAPAFGNRVGTRRFGHLANPPF